MSVDTPDTSTPPRASLPVTIPEFQKQLSEAQIPFELGRLVRERFSALKPEPYEISAAIVTAKAKDKHPTAQFVLGIITKDRERADQERGSTPPPAQRRKSTLTFINPKAMEGGGDADKANG